MAESSTLPDEAVEAAALAIIDMPGDYGTYPAAELSVAALTAALPHLRAHILAELKQEAWEAAKADPDPFGSGYRKRCAARWLRNRLDRENQ